MIAPTCQRCGAPLDAIAKDAFCPVCLLQSTLEPEDDEPLAPGGAELPRAFGPYRLLKEIGRGGMGVVYQAEQPGLSRTVAVKLLLSGAYSTEAALRRFQLEAAAAAGLQHPNIVAIHDYGECDGQPYYAMDLVTGRNLAELCAGRPLPVPQAAEIIRQLAGAVHYAHQCGILHRDLKPSNVLVGEAGRPRITDFGLAKMLGTAEGATLTGQMLGSPSYVAPEQAAGRFAEIGVVTDVYGLGALFYHLVTGRAPFNAATSTETLRLVLDTEPPSPRLLNPGLPRDLETICLKCLAKEPARRYLSAAEVADDLVRFLDERPIRARPPSAGYRMRKFTRRHRAVVAGASVAVVALFAGLAIALAGYRRAVIQRRAADTARGQAEQLVGLMTQDVKPALEQRGGLPQLLKTTEATVRYYESLPPELRNTKTDRGQADALAALADLRGLSLHDRKGAEAALRAALALRMKIARENPGDPEAAAAWLWDEWELPEVIGDSAACGSETRQEEFIHRWQALLARFPDNLRVKQGLAEVLSLYAQCISADKPKEALAAATQCRTLVDELAAARPQDKTLGALIEKSLFGLATAQQFAGETAESIAVSEQALAYCTAALKADPGNLKLRWQTAESARMLSYRDLSPRGVAAERLAREHYRVLIELDPDDQKYRSGYAVTHRMECSYLVEDDPISESTRKALRECLALNEPFVGLNGYELLAEVWFGDWVQLALCEAWAGEPAGSRRELERAQLRFAEHCSRLPAGSFERSISRVRFLCLMQWALCSLHDWPELARVARDCLAETEVGLKKQPAHTDLLPLRAAANAFLGVAAQREGRSAEAIALLQPAFETMRTAHGAHSVNQLEVYRNIAEETLIEAWAQHGDLGPARQAVQRRLLSLRRFSVTNWMDQEFQARWLTLAARVCDSAEAPLSIALADRAEIILTRPAAKGRMTVDGQENLATIARLRAAAAAKFELTELEKTGRRLDEAAATDPKASEYFTRAGEASWNLMVSHSAIASRNACEAELTAREGYRTLISREPENHGYRFLHAATYRMECYIHLGWDGQVEPARAAFRQYDALLEPFVGRKGYDSVLRTRLENSLHLAQLAASVGDKADAERWLAEARKRFEAYRDRLPERSPDRGLASIRFLEVSAWTAWWLRDWPNLARLAQNAQAECEAALKKQPASEELLKRQAMADGFAALAVAGAGQSVEAATLLQAARDRLKTTAETQSVYGVCDGDTVVWAIENAWVEALRENGDLPRARKWTDGLSRTYERWVPSLPEYWRAQKHLAVARVRAASVLDPTVSFEAARRKELLDQAAATLAPDKVAGRLTVDVQEALQEIERLRAAPPSVPR